MEEAPLNDTNQEPSYSPNKQLAVGISVTVFLLFIGLIGYFLFKGNTSGQSDANKNVLNASTTQITPVQGVSSTPQNATAQNVTPASEANTSPSEVTNKACNQNGPAQKWEYLVAYVVKDGDSLQSIATSQLNDATRVNEIIQINGPGPYVVGATLYLPPSSITKSSGNLKEVYGMLVKKDSSYWQLSYSSDPKGLGILIPSFWFDGIANSNSFIIGSCIKVLFDDGNKVYSVSPQ